MSELDPPAGTPFPAPQPGDSASDDAAAEPAPAPAAPERWSRPEELVLHLLSTGPRTPRELTQGFDAAWPGFLTRRSGLAHPLCLRLLVGGTIAVVEVDRGGRRRLAYARAAPAGTESAAATATPSDSRLPPALARVRDRCVRRLGHSAPLAQQTARAVAEHLADDLDARVAAGEAAHDAVKATAREFGDPWRVGTDLGRIAAGREAILFPRSFGESLRNSLIHDAPILLSIVAVIVVIRLQVLSAYHIPSRSMEPTLHGDPRGGDRILVNRLASTPERGDIWVFDGWGVDRTNFVKRCMGLPGDELLIRGGDLYVNGRLLRKRGRLYDDLMFPWWSLLGEWRGVQAEVAEDDANEEDEASEDELNRVLNEEFKDALTTRFAVPSGRWSLLSDGTFVAERFSGGDSVLRLTERVSDDVYDDDPGDGDDSESGYDDVADLRVSLTVTLDHPDSEVIVRLSRGAQRTDAVLRVGSPIVVRVDDEDVLELATAVPALGTPIELRLANVDAVVRIDAGGASAEHDLPQPEYPTTTAPAGSFESRVTSGGAQIRVVSIERDVHWTSDDASEHWSLGEDEFFMLGDNSGNSRDSREHGTVHRSRLIGRPLMIVWPPKRMRLLRGPDVDDQ